jgi:magnesium and cobalt transporter
MELEYLAALTGTVLGEAGLQTVGGLVVHRMGKIPSRGEEAVVGGLRFRVMEADKRRVTKVFVERVRR